MTMIHIIISLKGISEDLFLFPIFFSLAFSQTLFKGRESLLRHETTSSTATSKTKGIQK